MASPSPVLPRQRPDPYRPVVPRPPKSFKIHSVSIEPLQPRGYLPTGPATAVPSRFEAHFALGMPDVSVTIEVFVDGTLGPAVLDFAVRAKAQAPVTTSMLRQILVDQLLQRAMEAATVPASVREEWLSSLPAPIQAMAQDADLTPEPTLTAGERTRVQFDKDAETAARLWHQAVAGGSRRPGVEVAQEMRRSRAQVARYLRRARELGQIPPATADKND